MSEAKSLNKDLALVQALYLRTKDGALDWKPQGNRFRAESGGYVILVGSTVDSDFPNDPDYYVSLSDVSGVELERISNVSLRPVSDLKGPDGLTAYKLLSEIYQMARRKALRVDQVIDNVLASLTR